MCIKYFSLTKGGTGNYLPSEKKKGNKVKKGFGHHP